MGFYKIFGLDPEIKLESYDSNEGKVTSLKNPVLTGSMLSASTYVYHWAKLHFLIFSNILLNLDR
jgi:hypothetical protein